MYLCICMIGIGGVKACINGKNRISQGWKISDLI